MSNEELCLLAQAGNAEAMRILAEANLPFVKKTAWQIYRSYGRKVELDDLVQSGCVGLLDAVAFFDVEKGNAFLTYAVYWIKKRMREEAAWQQSIFEETAETTEEEIRQNDPRPSVEEQVIWKDTLERLGEAFCAISPRQRQYLSYRFIKEANTLQDAAAYFGIYERSARRLENSALSELRKKMA